MSNDDKFHVLAFIIFNEKREKEHIFLGFIDSIQSICIFNRSDSAFNKSVAFLYGDLNWLPLDFRGSLLC